MFTFVWFAFKFINKKGISNEAIYVNAISIESSRREQIIKGGTKKGWNVPITCPLQAVTLPSTRAANTYALYIFYTLAFIRSMYFCFHLQRDLRATHLTDLWLVHVENAIHLSFTRFLTATFSFIFFCYSNRSSCLF